MCVAARQDRYTALMWAAECEDPRAARALLDSQTTDVDLISYTKKRSALMVAASLGHDLVVDVLLSANADVGLVDFVRTLGYATWHVRVISHVLFWHIRRATPR